MPNAMVAASKVSSATGKAKASPTRKTGPSSCPPTLRRARSIIRSEKSTPTALPPGCAAWKSPTVTLPVPQATSRARPPGLMPETRTARCRQRGSWKPEMTKFMAS